MFCRIPGSANQIFGDPISLLNKLNVATKLTTRPKAKNGVVLKLRLNPSILISLYQRGGAYIIVGREYITLFPVIKAPYSVITNLRVWGSCHMF